MRVRGPARICPDRPLFAKPKLWVIPSFFRAEIYDPFAVLHRCIWIGQLIVRGLRVNRLIALVQAWNVDNSQPQTREGLSLPVAQRTQPRLLRFVSASGPGRYQAVAVLISLVGTPIMAITSPDLQDVTASSSTAGCSNLSLTNGLHRRSG